MMTTSWTLYANGTERVAVPRTPLLVRLRQMTSDAFYDQPALKPLKRFMEACFITGPLAVLVSLYLPRFGGAVFAIGAAALLVSAFYWFGAHWLCGLYLRRRGYAPLDVVEADSVDAALAAGPR